jgi:hypothetical protein
MFRTYEIKNADRRGKNDKKISPINSTELFIRRADERTVPYYSIVPEQFKKDARIKQLSLSEDGAFMVLCREIWKEGALFNNFPAGNADRMRMELNEWEALQRRLLDLGLLIMDPKCIYLVQPELREQYLQFLIAHPGGAKQKDEFPFNLTL